MANISPQHIVPVTCGSVALLVVAALGIAVLNRFANK